ncbi:MAG: PLP-dependent transferase [Nanoarchaeota archaeon]
MVAGEFGGESALPLHLSTVCAQRVPGELGLFEYARIDSPTRIAAQRELGLAVGARHSLLFNSGMSAIAAVLMSLSARDHVVCCDEVYEGTKRLLDQVLRRLGIEVDSFHQASEVPDLLRNETRMIFGESISNPLLQRLDVASLARIKGNALLVVDSTMTPMSSAQLLALGTDVVIHSTTKFIGGHHDAMGGAVLMDDDSLHDRFEFLQQTLGVGMSPFDCFLTSRGLKTLAVRFERQCRTATELASWLGSQDFVEDVLFPETESTDDDSGSGGDCAIISVRIVPGRMERFIQGLRLIKVSQSFGGVGTTIQVPRRMMDFKEDARDLDAKGLTDSLVRISVGLEAIEDIKNDFLGRHK